MKKLATLTLAIAMSCSLAACSSPEPEVTVATRTVPPLLVTPSPKPTPAPTVAPTTAPSSEDESHMEKIIREAEEEAERIQNNEPMGITKTDFVEGVTAYFTSAGLNFKAPDSGEITIYDNDLYVQTAQDSDEATFISFTDRTSEEGDLEQIIAFAYASIMTLDNALSTEEMTSSVTELLTNKGYGLGGNVIINELEFDFTNLGLKILTIEKSAT